MLWTGDVAYLVESFPSIDKALSSIPNPILYKLDMVYIRK